MTDLHAVPTPRDLRDDLNTALAKATSTAVANGLIAGLDDAHAQEDAAVREVSAQLRDALAAATGLDPETTAILMAPHAGDAVLEVPVLNVPTYQDVPTAPLDSPENAPAPTAAPKPVARPRGVTVKLHPDATSDWEGAEVEVPAATRWTITFGDLRVHDGPTELAAFGRRSWVSVRFTKPATAGAEA